MKDTGAGVEQVREAFRRRRGPALFAFALVSAGSIGLATGLPNVYKATATILVEPPRGLEAPQAEEVQARLQLITEELQSRDRLNALIDRFGLYATLRGRLSEVALLERMRRDIRLELKGPDRASGRAVVALALSYRAGDPATAARVANEIAAAYVEADTRLRGGTVAALAGQLSEVKGRLEQQERQVGEFQERFKGELPQQLEVNAATLERLEAQLRVVADARVRAAERRSALLRQLAEEGRPGAAETRETRLAGLRRQLADLERSYTDKYPDVAGLRKEIADLERQPAVRSRGEEPQATGSPAMEAALRGAEAEVRSLSNEERRLGEEARRYRERVEGAPRLQQELQRRVRDYETTRALYNALLKRLQESELPTQAGGAGNQGLRLLEEARAPKEPIAPRRLQLVTLGLMLALSASGAWIAVAEKVDSSFHSADEITDFTRVPVLAAIPLIAAPQRATRRLGLQALIATAGVLCLVLVGQLSHRIASQSPEIASLLARGR